MIFWFECQFTVQFQIPPEMTFPFKITFLQSEIRSPNQKYHFDQPLYKQYLYYLNDLSPLSFHNSEPDYESYFSLLKTKDIYIVFKKPYLRTSFYLLVLGIALNLYFVLFLSFRL